MCSYCSTHLPYTDFYTYSPNPMEMLFWGRAEIAAATALLYFRKGGGVQELVHQLKYKGQCEIGVHFGRELGITLAENPVLASVDALLPIPLHPGRQRKRGYNQSEAIAEGVAAVLHKPVVTSVLVRQVNNATQTRKGLSERWENVRSIFRLADETALSGKHVLLVDDVVTTGSTIEAAATVLSRVTGVRLSVATLAYDV